MRFIARLREPRVRRVLESMLTGASLPADIFDNDLSYTLGLSLVRVERGELQQHSQRAPILPPVSCVARPKLWVATTHPKRPLSIQS